LFDFRYHALSLVAVFLALGIGIVLGVTIGDSLVSDAERNIRASLRGDVVDARDDADQARADLKRRDAAIAAALPVIADSRLRGRAVAILGLGSLSGGVEDAARNSVELARGTVDSTTTLDVPDDLERLGNAAGGRFARLRTGKGRTPSGRLVRRLGMRIGHALARGRPEATGLAAELPKRFGGDFAGADAVVLYRSPPDEARGSTAKANEKVRTEFEEGLLGGLERAGARIVGAEKSDTDPSQVGWFEKHDLSSVDNVDVGAGRAALVLTLEGANGTFGFKRTADRPLPKVAGSGG
jgi:copper transport outer membrane protein MctB